MSEKSKANWNLLLLITMCFIVLRGLVVLLTSNLIQNVNFIYWTAGALLYLLGAIGLYKLFICNVGIPKRLKQLLCINFVLMAYWTMYEILLGGDFTTLNNGFLLLGLAPFSLILLKNLSEKSIRVFLAVVTAILSLSVLYDFAQLNDLFGFGDLDAAMSRHELLRPSAEVLAKSNNLQRAIGLMGPLPHNASQINSMLAVFWFMLLFNTKNYRYFMIVLGLFVCSFAAAIFSFVVSNIIAMSIGLGLGLVINAMPLKKNIGRLLSIALMVSVIIISIVWFFDLNMASRIIEAVTLRANSNTGDWENMLDWRVGSLAPDILSFFFGHDALMGSRLGTLEIGLLGLIFQFGIFIWLPFLYLMTYPIVKYASSGIHPRLKRQCIPEVMAILTGVLTLWHYKSLLQTPNMIVFLVIYISAVVKCYKPAHQKVQNMVARPLGSC